MLDLAAIEAALRAQALAYPEASEHFPWGERVVKVGSGKSPRVFVFLAGGKDGLTITLKLPHSRDFALMFDACTPTGYGLGKSGWVTVRLPPDSDLDPDLLSGWLEESYRAVAPKRLVRAQFGS